MTEAAAAEKRQVSFVSVGAGGYGAHYLRAFFERGEAERLTISGIVEPFADRIAQEDRARIQALDIPVYPSLDEFYSRHSADYCVISSPIQFHKEQLETALANGSHVLCEKPISATVEQAEEMIALRDKYGKKVAIGFQWSFAPAMLALKQDLLAGRYGRPMYLKSRLLWPRDAAYYGRGIGWAGSIRDKSGRLTLDSVANNATAHYLHNMFFLCGGQLDRSASVQRTRALLLRANPIENYDTCFIETDLISGQGDPFQTLFIATHAVNEEVRLECEYRFENATVRIEDGQVIAYPTSGDPVDYGNANADDFRKLFVMADAVRGLTEIPCSMEAALEHTRCIGLCQSSMTPQPFPQDVIRHQGELTWVEGLAELTQLAYNQERLPTADDAPYAQPGEWR